MGSHLHSQSAASDPDHVMWLNRYIGREKLPQDLLQDRLARFFDTDSIKRWIIRIFVERFYGESPHRFMVEMQDPPPWVLKGYALEHHHFLKQWVRSCSLIIANTDSEEIQQYELDNLVSEWHGIPGKVPSHHELLLRMGESYGVDRARVYSSSPLHSTETAVQAWDRICREFS